MPPSVLARAPPPANPLPPILSYGRRVLDLPYECSTVIDLDYAPPGYLAPGSSCDILVTFRPKANEDLFTCIPCLAETGAFEIPVHCLIRRAVLSCNRTELDFDLKGGVLLAESLTLQFTLTNDGALDARYAIALDGEAAEEEDASRRGAGGDQGGEGGEGGGSGAAAAGGATAPS